LEEGSKSKTEFVFFIAHQLRAPLSAVRLSFLMFRDGDLGKVSSRQKEILEADIKELDSLLGTIESLLDIPRIEQRQLSFDKEVMSLEKFLSLVENLLKDFLPSTKQKDISFDYTVPSIERKIFLELDWDKVKQVLENLFDNALHYTKSNGQISLNIKIEKGFLVVSLSDSGIGIPKLEQANIFQKFYRASNARALSSKGTGIGLYLAKFMVESHGGKIWFDSQESQGATFYFSLPLRGDVEEFLKNI
ncbi:MAG: ATP-binding protein, partial [bacterium]